MKKSTIRAINASIKHWEKDILKPLQDGHKVVGGFFLKQWDNGDRVHCYDIDCPLCRLFGPDCPQCPLKSCGRGSVYEKFTINPNVRTAKAVIRKLKSLLPKEQT